MHPQGHSVVILGVQVVQVKRSNSWNHRSHSRSQPYFEEKQAMPDPPLLEIIRRIN